MSEENKEIVRNSVAVVIAACLLIVIAATVVKAAIDGGPSADSVSELTTETSPANVAGFSMQSIGGINYEPRSLSPVSPSITPAKTAGVQFLTWGRHEGEGPSVALNGRFLRGRPYVAVARLRGVGGITRGRLRIGLGGGDRATSAARRVGPDRWRKFTVAWKPRTNAELAYVSAQTGSTPVKATLQVAAVTILEKTGSGTHPVSGVASKSCGDFQVRGVWGSIPIKVEVLEGNIPCRVAQRVMQDEYGGVPTGLWSCGGWDTGTTTCEKNRGRQGTIRGRL